jgi:hypothetical protein
MAIKIALYTRDKSGIIQYQGTKLYNSLYQFIKDYCPPGLKPEIQMLTDNQDTMITWRGSHGYSIRDYKG